MRKETRPQYYRLRRILEMIRKGTRTGDFPNAGVFTRELEVTRRTVLRDLDFLRSEENAPIEYDASRKGYRLTDAAWKLPPVHLKRQEFFAFCVARKLLGAFRGTPLETDMESTFSKLAETLKGTVTTDLENMTDHLTVLGEDYVKQDPEIWTKAVRHVEMRERVTIVYRKFDGVVKKYELEPYHLLAYHGNWYVLARHIDQENPATFALSRIQEIAGTGEYFEVPPSFDVRRHIDESFGIVRGNNRFRVRLLFSPNIATYIRERTWHPSQEMIEKEDGCLELRFETAGWKELVRWVLSWQPDVKVLAPAKLRTRVEEKMRQALSQ